MSSSDGWMATRRPAPPAPAGQAPLRAGEVHLWRFDLDCVWTQQSVALLSAEERARGARFRFEAHRRRFVAGRTVVRTILGRYLDREPRDLEFRYSPQGKPALRSCSNLTFSLSHSDTLALLAVGSVDPLGVDVERIHVIPEMDAIARRTFSPREASEVLSSVGPMRAMKFFRCWTRKEAFVKALGAGLSIDLSEFEVSLGAHPRILSIHGDASEAEKWTMRQVEPAPGYLASVAVRSASIDLSCFDWSTPAPEASDPMVRESSAPEPPAVLAQEG